MKTTLTLRVICILALFSGASYAQKRSASKSPTSSTSYSPQRFNQNSSNYGSTGSSWKFGADVMMDKNFFSDQNGGFGGLSFSILAVGDLSLNTKIGMTFKFGYETKKAYSPISGGELTANLNYIAIAALFRYNVDPSFSLAAGPIMNLGTSGSISASDNAGRSVPLRVGELSVPTQFGIELAAAYSIPVANTIEMQPSLAYDYYLTTPLSDGSGSMNNLKFGLGLRFKL